MNKSNLKIDDETNDTKNKVYYVSRVNSNLPWPSNFDLANFASNGKFKKYKILSIGNPNVKVVVIK